MEYVYHVTPQSRPVASLDDTMLPERSVGLRFADLAASMRTSLPDDSDLSVNVTQIPSSPRIGRLVIITSADKPTVEEALTTALIETLLMLSADPTIG